MHEKKLLPVTNMSSAWVVVQVFQLILLYKLMVENTIKTPARKTKQVLVNYGWQKKKKPLSFQSH